ncbi:hypothetical protein P9139_09165 [Curtobacterium flaccumfaciens]|nr:hypothetical protein P9139_09165 [Curtobacterium flaccumfaciens]
MLLRAVQGERTAADRGEVDPHAAVRREPTAETSRLGHGGLRRQVVPVPDRHRPERRRRARGRGAGRGRGHRERAVDDEQRADVVEDRAADRGAGGDQRALEGVERFRAVAEQVELGAFVGRRVDAVDREEPVACELGPGIGAAGERLESQGARERVPRERVRRVLDLLHGDRHRSPPSGVATYWAAMRSTRAESETPRRWHGA